MGAKQDIPASLLPPDRGDIRPVKSRRWFVFNRSPLARKIILFNLIALGILVSGVLYLNQAQEAEVEFRSEVLAQQAEMIAAAIRSHADDPDYGDIQSETFKDFFNSLAVQSNSIVQVYGDNGQIELTYAPPSRKITAEPAEDALTGFFQNIWANISAPLGGVTPADNEQYLQRQLAELARQAVVTNERTKNAVLSVGGEIYIAVALPLSGVGGAILISTRPGEIDTIIRTAREQILQMFLLATLSSIILSMVLANSIARPLRRLSAAAQKAHDDQGGKINLARVNIPDLTARPDEIGDLSRSMRNMTDALLDRIDENKSFAADVAHEIKNPLTSLRSAVETLEYVQDKDSQKALLAVISSDVERMDRLVTDISNASRLEAELVRDTWEEMDICALLREMVENFSARGKRDDVQFQLEITVSDCVIRGLKSRLAQVFTNLISNALSFAPDNGWVKVQASDHGEDGLEIRVSDNGPGIPQDNLQDVFSRFYSERPQEQFGEHSGLGLAISKQIVDAHGGDISATNTKEGGALFIVKLPR